MVKARSSAPKVNPKVSKSVPDTPLMHWEQQKQSPWLWSLAFELGMVEIYLGILPYVVVSTDYRPGDQSGRPEDPQTLLDCCYFLPPVCDWKRRSSAFIPTWAVFYSNQPFTARTGSKKRKYNRDDNYKNWGRGRGHTKRKEATSHLTFANGLELCQSTSNPGMHLL